MFGYIKIRKSELLVKEYELYKGLYCSLCKQLGKDYGFIGRMTLNYDFTFFLLCRMAIKDKHICFSLSHCSFNPRKKCVCCEKDDEDLAYTAALSILLTYHKLRDDLSDNGFLKKIPVCLLLPIFKPKYKKAKNKYPSLFDSLEQTLSNQKLIEDNLSATLDECADTSGKVLGEAFSYGVADDYKTTSYEYGYSIGRLIYILDAVDDYEKDVKNKTFNPFVVNCDKYSDDLVGNMKRILNNTADETARIYEKLPVKRFKSIINNVVFFGFEDTINMVFEKKG